MDKKRLKISNPKNAEEQVLAYLGRELYEKFFKNYTIKQWNVDPKNLDASVTKRIPIRYNDDDRYLNERFQAMPRNGYHVLFENILAGIDIRLNTNYFDIKNEIPFKNLIFTGLIDEFFNYKYNKLPYRSLKFVHEHYNQEYYQDWVQINYPNDYNYTRIVEIKHATGQKSDGTTIVKEFPADGGELFYPIPFQVNHELYKKYKVEGENLHNTYFIGRLATYRYLNMDQVVSDALELFEKIKKQNN